ncbi:MAG: DUF354 domain-containing protein [Thermoplasmata archaeon]
MRVLFNVAHPAHVHLFKNPISILQRKGHEIKIAALQREITEELLRTLGLQYVSIGKSHPELVVKSLDTMRRDLTMARMIKGFGPDLVVSTGIPYSAQAARICGVPAIAFSDTEIANLVLRSMLPFVSAVCTPSCFDLDLGPKHIKYDGYHELAYLHPDYFTPNPMVLDRFELKRGEPYILLRISAADSSHDLKRGDTLLADDARALSFVDWLGQFGRVMITSELPLPQQLEKYELNIKPYEMHDLMAYAAMYIGEGATMASEAGVLGIPWIYVSSTTRGYLVDQQAKYGLGRTVPRWDSVKDQAAKWMRTRNLKSSWQTRREELLRDKIDVVAFITEFIEDWPDSLCRHSGGNR